MLRLQRCGFGSVALNSAQDVGPSLSVTESEAIKQSIEQARHPQPANGAHDPCSHLANAFRLLKHFGNEMLFVRGIGWHTWGPPWRSDELGAIGRAQLLGRLIASEAGALGEWVAKAGTKDERDQRQDAMNRRFKWAGQSESANCIASSLELAQPLLACEAEELDADPYLLGLPHGVLDLRTGKHRPHAQADRITKTAGCDFVPGAAAPVWTAFISKVMDDDAELIDYLQRLAGYLLCGERGEHLLPIFWGGGANGKSTLIGAWQAMLGDYASGASRDLLMQRGANEHPTGLADLHGRRLVVVSESGDAGRLHEERVKYLTGGDTITARRMRQDFFEFKPTHQLILQTNHKPRATGTDEGLWRRVRLIPFGVTIPAEQRDPLLPSKLKADLPGILDWAVDGWRRYQAEGFTLPAAVRAATSSYRDESDLLAAFLADACVVSDQCTAMAGDLYAAYTAWCQSNGERPRSQRIFGTSLSERGFDKVKSTGGLMRWRGIGIANSGGSGLSGLDLSIPARGNNSYEGDRENRSTSSAVSTSVVAYAARRNE
jgi:putative DNA primase/helicase